MANELNENESVPSVAGVMLSQLKQTAKSMEVRAEAIKADQQRLDIFVGNIKWMINTIGAVIIAAFAGVGFMGIKSLNDIESNLTKEIDGNISERIAQIREGEKDLSEIANEYDSLEQDFEKYREWADALTLITTVSPEASDQSAKEIADRISFLSSASLDEAKNSNEAYTLLLALVELGEKGGVDSNTLLMLR